MGHYNQISGPCDTDYGPCSCGAWHKKKTEKYFLLIAGCGYYPQAGTDDWIGMFDTEQDAEQAVKKIPKHTYYTKGKDKGKVKDTYYSYGITHNGSYYENYDWYEIVDLRKWINK